jgi:hypothetical protein
MEGYFLKKGEGEWRGMKELGGRVGGVRGMRSKRGQGVRGSRNQERQGLRRRGSEDKDEMFDKWR